MSNSRDLPPLNALKALEAVVQTGGIRAAARRLGVSHSAVTRHIQELELWSGGSLFERRGKRLELTPPGRRLAEASAEAFDRIRDAATAVLRLREANQVSISTTSSFAARWLIPRLPAFRQRHPGIEVSLAIDQRLEDFASGQVDFAIRIAPQAPSGLAADAILSDRLFPVVGRSLAEGLGEAPALALLSGLPLIHDADPNAQWADWKTRYGPPDLDLKGGLRDASSDLALQAAATGQGVALARGTLAAQDLETGALTQPFPGVIELGPTYWAVMPEANRERPRVRLFIAWLQEQARAFEARRTLPHDLPDSAARKS